MVDVTIEHGSFPYVLLRKGILIGYLLRDLIQQPSVDHTLTWMLLLEAFVALNGKTV